MYWNKKLLVAPGIATRNPGIATSSKDASSDRLERSGQVQGLIDFDELAEAENARKDPVGVRCRLRTSKRPSEAD